jgi:hypothetical protein
MNLTPEIQTDWKRYLKTLPSADLLFPKWPLLLYGCSIALYTSCSGYSGCLSLKYPKFSPGILDRQDLRQLLTLLEVSAFPELANIFLVVTHGKHHAHLIIVMVAPADMLLHLLV